MLRYRREERREAGGKLFRTGTNKLCEKDKWIMYK
jgi:hypothetical protein